MGKDIDVVLQDIINDYKTVAKEAVADAAHKGQKDILNEAEKYLQLYYKRKPKMYKRKYHLKKAIKPVFEDNSTNDQIFITIGVEYDSAPLKGLYYSNSWYHLFGDKWEVVPSNVRADINLFSPDYGTPEPDYILDNFLSGKHGEAWTDSTYTANLMPDFLDNELPNKLGDYVQNALFDAIVKRL